MLLFTYPSKRHLTLVRLRVNLILADHPESMTKTAAIVDEDEMSLRWSSTECAQMWEESNQLGPRLHISHSPFPDKHGACKKAAKIKATQERRSKWPIATSCKDEESTQTKRHGSGSVASRDWDPKQLPLGS